MVTVRIFVEGGGDSKELKSRCREGFRKLLENSGFQGRMPGFVACGGRNKAFDMFCTSTLGDRDQMRSFLLVDSEDPVEGEDYSPESSIAWIHLEKRDKWDRPEGVLNSQVLLMTTCMETWIMADRDAIHAFFGGNIREASLLPIYELEKRPRDEVLESLISGTVNCGRNKAYRKGKRSFELLIHLNPKTLQQNLPHFQRFIQTLRQIK
ncbi:MAG: DUF4276 family protein [Methanobacteriota archaeon]